MSIPWENMTNEEKDKIIEGGTMLSWAPEHLGKIAQPFRERVIELGQWAEHKRKA